MNKNLCKGLVSGVLLGTVGIKALTGKEAKKIYTKITAVVLRGADDVMITAENLKENCKDIVDDAREINEKFYKEEEENMIKDAKEILKEAETEA